MSTSCQENAFQGKDCSVSFNQVTFTKALNNSDSLTSVSDSCLKMQSGAKCDYFNNPDGKSKVSNAPLLLTEVNNQKPFTIVAKVTPQFSETYDAGALYIYENSDRWQKFAFEMDERGNTRIVTVRTLDTSDDNNHEIIRQPSVYMKISSDIQMIGFYYSLDGETWYLARLYKNEFPQAFWFGVSSQSPHGNGILTSFEELSITDVAIQNFRMGI